MTNGDPILVLSYKCDTWIWDFSFAHFVRAILNVDPPLTAIRAAQIPLITSVDSFCVKPSTGVAVALVGIGLLLAYLITLWWEF